MLTGPHVLTGALTAIPSPIAALFISAADSFQTSKPQNHANHYSQPPR
jgi:hypothetical protein